MGMNQGGPEQGILGGRNYQHIGSGRCQEDWPGGGGGGGEGGGGGGWGLGGKGGGGGKRVGG